MLQQLNLELVAVEIRLIQPTEEADRPESEMDEMGVTWAKKTRLVGYGMPLTVIMGKFCPMYLGPVRMRFFCN